MRSFVSTTMSLILLLFAANTQASHAPSTVPGKLTADDQLSSKFRLNDDDPEGSIPSDKEKNANPIEFGYFVQDLLVQSEAALNAKEYGALVRYRRALVKASPERAVSWSKLCEAYELINDRDHAVRSCRQAIQRDGAVVQDFLRLSKLLLQKSGPLSPTDVTELQGVMSHLETSDPNLVTQAADLRCQLATKTNDAVLLESCTSVLVAKAPHDVKTVIYQWSLAVRQGKDRDAQSLFERARTMGVPAANLERMEKLTPGGLLGLRGSKGLIVASVVVLGLVGAAAFWASQRRRLPSHA